MVPFIMVNGMAKRKKAMVYNFGKMDLNMKDCGQIIAQMDKESSIILMETCMKDNGLMIGLMDTGCIHIHKGTLMLVNGSMTSKMEKAKKPGTMDQHLKENI